MPLSYGAFPARHVLNPCHRYLLHCRGVPVFSTDTVEDLVAVLWGEHIKDQWVAYDYERPCPVDTPDICAWLARFTQVPPQRDLEDDPLETVVHMCNAGDDV